jgi:hypothetical protein
MYIRKKQTDKKNGEAEAKPGLNENPEDNGVYYAVKLEEGSKHGSRNEDYKLPNGYTQPSVYLHVPSFHFYTLPYTISPCSFFFPVPLTPESYRRFFSTYSDKLNTSRV